MEIASVLKKERKIKSIPIVPIRVQNKRAYIVTSHNQGVCEISPKSSTLFSVLAAGTAAVSTKEGYPEVTGAALISPLETY